jgi:hypothetical protein
MRHMLVYVNHLPGAKSNTVRIKRFLGDILFILDDSGQLFLSDIWIAGWVSNVCTKAIVCMLLPNP